MKYKRYKVVCEGDHLLPLFSDERPQRVIGRASSDQTGGSITVWLDAMPVTGVMQLIPRRKKAKTPK